MDSPNIAELFRSTFQKELERLASEISKEMAEKLERDACAMRARSPHA